MNFDKDEYLRLIKRPETRPVAISMLEWAIESADTRTAFELHKLRTPAVITRMELDNLNKAGFPKDRLTPDGEPEILIMAWKAGAEHAKKYWPEQVANYYDMSAYNLNQEAA